MTDLVGNICNAALADPDPDPDALAVMQLSLVDWLAVGIAGTDEPVSRHVRQLAQEESGAQQASLFGGGRVPARMAALVNGTISHALDYDDTHFAHIGHPSVAILPAAVAIGERNGADLGQVTRAALAGCEASIRFGVVFGRDHYQQGFHQTGTAGAFGAALASVVQLTPDPTAVAQALTLVSTRAAGLKSQFGTMGKPYNAGAAAANGVEAALLAARGFDTNAEAITGQNGFLTTHHATQGAHIPEPGFLMTSVSHKFHACCHGLHATLEALATLPDLTPDGVSSIEVYTHPRWMTVCNQLNPTSGLGLKFSYKAAVALAILGYDTAALTTYSDAHANDPNVVKLSDAVQVTPDASLSETQSRIEVVFEGNHHSAQFDLDAPLGLDQRSARVRIKARALLGQDRADRIWDMVHGDAQTPVGELTALMA